MMVMAATVIRHACRRAAISEVGGLPTRRESIELLLQLEEDLEVPLHVVAHFESMLPSKGRQTP